MEFKAMNRRQTVLVKVEARNKEEAFKKIEKKLAKLGKLESWENAGRLIKYIDPSVVKE